MVTRRLKAVWDFQVPEIREFAGVHDYDGTVQDLSPSGVSACLASLGPKSADERLADRHDEDHLAATEAMLRATFELVQAHRWNPIVHLANLDLACYDREYAPEAERAAARAAHLAQWPDAIDGALESLDSIPAPVAGALVGAIAGLADDIGPEHEPALAAHGRLLARIEDAATNGNPDAALGSSALTRLLGDSEAMPVDLGRLEDREGGLVAEQLDVVRVPGDDLAQAPARADKQTEAPCHFWRLPESGHEKIAPVGGAGEGSQRHEALVRVWRLRQPVEQQREQL